MATVSKKFWIKTRLVPSERNLSRKICLTQRNSKLLSQSLVLTFNQAKHHSLDNSLPSFKINLKKSGNKKVKETDTETWKKSTFLDFQRRQSQLECTPKNKIFLPIFYFFVNFKLLSKGRLFLSTHAHIHIFFLK